MNENHVAKPNWAQWNETLHPNQALSLYSQKHGSWLQLVQVPATSFQSHYYYELADSFYMPLVTFPCSISIPFTATQEDESSKTEVVNHKGTFVITSVRLLSMNGFEISGTMADCDLVMRIKYENNYFQANIGDGKLKQPSTLYNFVSLVNGKEWHFRK